jgi:formylmethanofuran dehydrogenase subunit B
MGGPAAVILARHEPARGSFGVTSAPVRGSDHATLCAARRVLVTGHGGLAAETAARACDLAEAVGAAVDFGGLDTAQVAGPSIARIGEVTADPEDLRDRADLVVFWFCDPAADAPDFLQRFVTPATAAGRPRHAIAVGPHAVATSSAADRHLRVAADLAVDLARLLHAAVAGRAVAAGPLVAACDALRGVLDAAGCVAFVTDHRDPVGLEPWSLLGLVRTLAHAQPAFEVPLVPPGAATVVSTWRYGAAGAIARADRDGAEFRPAECDAARLVARGEVDVVVAVGPPSPAVEAAIAARGTALAVVRIVGDDAVQRSRLDALITAVHGHSRDGGAA